MNRLLLMLIILAAPAPQYAQTCVLAEAGAGAGFGWWIHQKGTEQDSLPNYFSWERTHLSPFLSLHGSLHFRKDKWTLGAGGAFALHLDSTMVGSSSSSTTGDRIRVGDPYVQMVSIFGSVQYRAAINERGNFTFSPCLKAGMFLLQSVHPQQSAFRPGFLCIPGVTLGFRAGRNEVFVRPVYAAMRMKPESARLQEKHKLFYIGVEAGVQFRLYKSKS